MFLNLQFFNRILCTANCSCPWGTSIVINYLLSSDFLWRTTVPAWLSTGPSSEAHKTSPGHQRTRLVYGGMIYSGMKPLVWLKASAKHLQTVIEGCDLRKRRTMRMSQTVIQHFDLILEIKTMKFFSGVIFYFKADKVPFHSSAVQSAVQAVQYLLLVGDAF